MANPNGSFVWYELLTTDLAAARAFYAEVAALDIPEAPAPGPMDYRMISAPDGDHVGGAMALTEEMVSGGARAGWFGYVGVADVDAAVTQAAAAGATVQMPPSDIPGAGRIAMIADPQGAPLYLMTPTPPVGAEDATSGCFDPQKIGHVAWNELHANDSGAALAFYQELLGWAKSDALDMGPMGIYQMFKPGGTDRAVGAMMTSPNMPHPLWLYYLTVADIDEAARRTTAQGGTLLFGPSEIPGGHYMLQATDPQGAMFALVGPRTGA